MRPSRYAAVALLSAALIALEVTYTRILSAAFFYTFAFLVISLAVLGLGAGALAARLLAGRRGTRPATLLVGAGFAALFAPQAVTGLGLDFARLLEGPAMPLRLLAAVVLLALPFGLAGAGLAQLFRENAADMPRLYMADLAGAAAGALGAVLAMSTVEVPLASVLAAAPLLLAGVVLARPGRGRAVAAAASVAGLAAAGLAVPLLLDLPSRVPLGPVIHERWDAMARLTVHEADGQRAMNIDNGSVAPAYRFDGNFATNDPQSFFEHVRETLGVPGGHRVLALGAGGGRDVLQSLTEGASEVHAVEVNPAINELMTRGLLRDWTGRIYLDPRVKVVTEDGRAYIRRFDGAFDAILSYSSNSFAALASGAFALSENYLFTTEAFEEYLRALRPRGILVMEHQFYIPRAVSEALEALRRLGVADPERHVAVFSLGRTRRMSLVVGRAPLTDAQVDTIYGPLAAQKDEDVHLLWPETEKHEGNLVARIVRNGWRAEAAGAPFDVSPVDDDRPFAAQMGLWRNASLKVLSGKIPPHEFQGFPLAKLIVLAILAVVLLVGAPLLALPRLLRGERLGTAPALYFAAIGVGFMAVEVVLIQQFTLLIGAASSTFVVILVTLLLASGIGSRWAEATPWWLPFAAIGVLLALDLSLFPALARGAGTWPLAGRIAVAIAALAPLGFFMGQPFPKGALRAGDLVDWGFAVNGVTSIVGSALALLVAFEAGFGAALVLGGAAYGVAAFALAPSRAWNPATT